MPSELTMTAKLAIRVDRESPIELYLRGRVTVLAVSGSAITGAQPDAYRGPELRGAAGA